MKVLFKAILLLVFSVSIVQAQNDPLVSHQGLQRFIYNPASTGMSDYFNLGLITRTQWVSFPGQPRTILFTASRYFPAFNFGAGINFFQDIIGLESNSILKFCYAYNLELGDVNNLSFGAGAGFVVKRFDLSKQITEQSGDQALLQVKNSVKPDFDFGIEFSRQNLAIGISSTHFTNSYKNDKFYKYPRHFHLYAGYNHPVNENILLKGFSSLYISNTVKGAELTLIGEYNKFVWGGLTHRFKESLVILVGVEAINNFRIGYSYDMNYARLRRYTSGSHELFLHYRFTGKKRESNSPRFFN